MAAFVTVQGSWVGGVAFAGKSRHHKTLSQSRIWPNRCLTAGTNALL